MSNQYLILIILATCLLAFQSSFGQQAIFDQYASVEPVRIEANQVNPAWENHHFSTDDCKCVYGDDYFLAIKEAEVETTNLMITLQGGGACWPGTIQCKAKATDADVKDAAFINALADKLPDSWHQVFIPYCDGSVYMGDGQRDYDNDNKTDHWHDGLKMSVASLNVVKEKFPEANRIFITGCSAGGYGTIIQTRLLRHLYPEAAIYVLNESGPGLLRPDTTTREVVDAAWNLSRLIPANCASCEDQMLYWYSDLLKDPDIKIGLYSSYEDGVIGQSFLKLKPEAYKKLLLTTSNDLNQAYPDQFKRFFINGNTHCVQDRNYTINGATYWDWVLAFVQDDPAWKDTLE